MNTNGLNSNIADLALIVAKLKKAESTAELWAAGEDNITDKYAYKYGLMVGQVNAVVDALETRLTIIQKALEVKPAVTEEKPRGIEFLEVSGYYESVLNDVKSAVTYDDAIEALIEWFNDLDRSYELGSGYLELRIHAVLAYGFFDRNGWL